MQSDKPSSEQPKKGVRARVFRRRRWLPRGYSGNPSLRWMSVLALCVFIWSGVAPRHRADWALENLLVVLALAALVWTHRRFRFSNFSWWQIFAFYCLHAVGTHYTYSYAPPGEWIAELFSANRNSYDRFVHFACGLLLAYPLHEVARRVTHLRGGWSYAIPLLVILGVSAFYEILESIAARVFAPELGIAFVGAQGDVWDAQKDMGLAALGTVISLVACAVYRRSFGHEPWRLLADPVEVNKAAGRSESS